MSLYPIIWALEHAPVIDAAERAVLMALANKGDFDGCNAYRGYPALARVAKVDPKTVKRKCHAMEKRGILRRQTGKMPEGWLKLPADKKTVVWEIMIPHSHYSPAELANTNETRAERGRPPITPQNRPDIREAEKLGRKDKGQERPERRKKKETDSGKPGDTKSPGTEGTQSPPATGHEVPPRGDSESPNPLMGPSDLTLSSSSAEVEDVTNDVVPQVPKKKMSQSPEDIVMQRTHCTPDEARMVVDYIEQQGDGRGGRIRSLAWWVTNREERTLLSDLAHIRRHSAAPTATECGDHHQTMPTHGCPLCAAEIKAGDHEDLTRLRAHLALVGEKARPDLARLLGAPQTPTGATAGGWSWEHQHRAERRHRNGVVGGTRHGIETPDTYDTMAQMSQDELRALMLG